MCPEDKSEKPLNSEAAGTWWHVPAEPNSLGSQNSTDANFFQNEPISTVYLSHTLFSNNSQAVIPNTQM